MSAITFFSRLSESRAADPPPSLQWDLTHFLCDTLDLTNFWGDSAPTTVDGEARVWPRAVCSLRVGVWGLSG